MLRVDSCEMSSKKSLLVMHREHMVVFHCKSTIPTSSCCNVCMVSNVKSDAWPRLVLKVFTSINDDSNAMFHNERTAVFSFARREFWKLRA